MGQVRECHNMKYTTMRAELREKHLDFKVNLTNVIVDDLGVYSKGLREQVTTLLVKNATRRMLVNVRQNTILLHDINQANGMYYNLFISLIFFCLVFNLELTW